MWDLAPNDRYVKARWMPPDFTEQHPAGGAGHQREQSISRFTRRAQRATARSQYRVEPCSETTQSRQRAKGGK